MIAVLALVMSLECELPPWLRDQPAAIRDSADAIADGVVTAIRYAPDPEIAEVEVELAVLAAWRAGLGRTIRASIHDYECGPQLQFGSRYMLGLKFNWYRQPIAVFAAVRYPAADTLKQLLGPPVPRTDTAAEGGTPIPLTLIVALGTVIIIVAAGALWLRYRFPME